MFVEFVMIISTCRNVNYGEFFKIDDPASKNLATRDNAKGDLNNLKAHYINNQLSDIAMSRLVK